MAITETTNKNLRDTLQRLEAKRNGMVGLGTDYTSGLHDDPAVVREMQQLDRNIDKIRSILKLSEVLPPREDTSELDIGNRVSLKFEDEGVEESFRLGSATDSSYDANGVPWVSVESPLGRELVGKKEGETVIYKIGRDEKRVSITGIFTEK